MCRREFSLGLGEHDWWMTLPAGAVLGEHALYWYASTALSSPQSRLLYSDHDHLDADGCRVRPEFKPDWSLELLRSSNYLRSAVALRADLVAEVSSVALDRVAMALANGMAGKVCMLISCARQSEFLLRRYNT